MGRYNVREDLQFRTNAEVVRIFATSGPNAVKVMQLLKNKQYDEAAAFIQERIGREVVANPEAAAAVVREYGDRILAPPPW